MGLEDLLLLAALAAAGVLGYAMTARLDHCLDRMRREKADRGRTTRRPAAPRRPAPPALSPLRKDCHPLPPQTFSAGSGIGAGRTAEPGPQQHLLGNASGSLSLAGHFLGPLRGHRQ